jgi:hypothetical protein
MAKGRRGDEAAALKTQRTTLRRMEKALIGTQRCQCRPSTPTHAYTYRGVKEDGAAQQRTLRSHSLECAEVFLRGLELGGVKVYPESWDLQLREVVDEPPPKPEGGEMP